MSAVPRRDQAGAPVRSRRLPDLGVRAVSGFTLIFVALAATLVGGTLFLVVWLVAASAMLFEWQRLVGGAARRLRTLVGIAGLVFVAVLARDGDRDMSIVFVLTVSATTLMAGPRKAWAAAGIVYVGLFVLAIISLRFSHPDGVRAMLWLFSVVWATDVFAYLGGRLIGGPKLWPRISPSKTWSGTLTGLAAGALIGTFTALRDRFDWPALVPMLALTLAAGLLSQVGDAFESAIKRHFGVKDTSRLIPGHGGLMDRLDGFVAAAIFAYLVGLVRDLASVAQGLFEWH